MTSLKAIVIMSDYGHDPTETAGPYTAFQAAGFDVSFVTENGKAPECDKRMLQGVTQKLLVKPPLLFARSGVLLLACDNTDVLRQGAKKETVALYNAMAQSSEYQHPLSWSAPDFSLDPYDLVFLPGGHEKSVRQVIDSEIVHKLMADYFPKTLKPGKKTVAAICHGVMVLSESKGANGESILHQATTTTLPTFFEQFAFWGTRAFLGDYYKTYGVEADSIETCVRKILVDQKQFKSSLVPTPFVVEDEKYNYISARFPGDVDLFSEKIVKLVQSLH